MNSYKDLSKQQVVIIEKLGKYDVPVKQIAARAGATYNQVYNWYKKNGRNIIPVEELKGANKSHYTLLINGENNRRKKIESAVVAKAKTNVQFTIPANKMFTLQSNADGSVNIIY